MHDYFIFSLFSLLCLDTATFGFIIPLLPDLILSRGISLSVFGFILSFYPIGYFIISIIFGKILHHYSKINLLFLCQFLLTISNVIYALMAHVESPALCIFISIVARSIQGVGIGGASSILYSYVPVKYPNKIEETYSFLEIATGSGVVFGSIFAGFLYEYTSYMFSFLLMAVIYVVFSIVFVKSLEYELEKSRIERIMIQDPEVSHLSIHSSDGFFNKIHDEDLSFSLILKNKNFVISFLCQCFCCITVTLLQPSFSEHVKSLGGSSQDIGLIFAACDITYASTALFIFKYFLRFGRKKLFLFGGIIACIGLLIIGPEKYTFLPNNLYIVGLGMAFNGFAQVFFTVPVIPEYMDALEGIFGKNEGINEMAAGLFNAGLAISEFFGPIFGGILANNFGVSRGMSIYAVVLMLYLRIYWTFAKEMDKRRKKEKGGKVREFEMRFFSN